jgi:uncharacterized membrane protein
MQALILILRVVHIGLGVFWVGTVFFTNLYLFPAVQEAGPEGNKVMGALVRRGFLQMLPIVAILNMISGLWLFWIVSGGLEPVYVGSKMGMVLATSGVIAILTFVIGVAVIRPSAQKAMQLGQSLANLSGRERDETMATVAALRKRTELAGGVSAVLLGVTVVGMSIARYL